MWRVTRKIIICYFCTSVRPNRAFFSLTLSLLWSLCSPPVFSGVRLYFMSSRADFYTKKQNILNMWMFGKFFLYPQRPCHACRFMHFVLSKKYFIFEQNKNIFGNCIAKVLRAESGQTGNMSFFSLGFLFNNT